jgi:tetratricopeptide (TPR) repeat protein
LADTRWSQLEALFHGALEQPAERRHGWLRDHCTDPELKREVEALLQEEAADAFRISIDAALEDVVSGAAFETSRAGQDFGPWRLIEEIGQGGMGAVWLAERADDAYSARVALKFVRGAVRSTELERRFRAERQILADLKHPNIARLLDGGVGPDGVPFLAMEYVSGIAIDEYVEVHGSSTEERLRLFTTVCDAVQHAHGELVVHRDLKPSNILVDEDGTPKLVDFGIAKLLGESEGAEATRAGPLTPAYASPEQIRGERVTVASDVFALGVVLYELLSGVQPFRTSGATPVEVQSRVLDADPVPPSNVARSGEVHAPVPPRDVTGDLDRIVMMALRKEPERRYATVGHLADDVRRHLEGRPIAARPSTAGYRIRKFVSRNRAPVFASVLALTVVAGLIVFYTARVARERDVAERERATAEQVVGFLTEMFEEASPARALGDSVTVREALDLGRDRLATELDGQPQVRARLLNTLGRTYLSLGAVTSADSLLHEALRLHERVSGMSTAAVADVLDDLALLEARRDGYEPGLDYAGRALEIRELRGDPLPLAHSLVGLANVIGTTAPDSAESLLDRALLLQESLLGEDAREVADTRYALGVTLLRQGRYPESIAEFRAVRTARDALLPENHPDRNAVINTMAVAFYQNAQIDSARVLWEEALDRQVAVLGSAHPEVATAYANLATALPAGADPDSALALLNRALDIRTRVYGDWSSDVANTLMTIGNDYGGRGRWTDAVDYFERAIAIYDSVLPPYHRDIYFPLYNVGVALNSLERYAEARPYLQRSVEIAERVLGTDHPSTAITLQALGFSVQSLGDSSRAIELFQDSVDRFARGAPNHPWVAYPVESLIEVHRERGAWVEVDSLARTYWISIARIHEADAAALANALTTRAQAARAVGRGSEADSLEAEARAVRGREGGQHSPGAMDEF